MVESYRFPILVNRSSTKTEQDFRRAYWLHKIKISASDPELSQAYQEYISTYRQITSIYLIRNENHRTDLFIYNTEDEREESKALETPEILNWGTSITQLPNNELFIFGKADRASGITLIIDRNLNIRKLPSGTPCSNVSCIYFNKYVYCFGGFDKDLYCAAFSESFDLERNRWNKLILMPEANSFCNSVIFNGNILISGFGSRNLFLYSVDINSFSIIPYAFAEMKWKILISLERLYLIELGHGFIYESEIGDAYNWKQIAKSKIIEDIVQAHCSYNEGNVYIGFISYSTFNYYYKFGLDEKVLIKL